MIFYHVKRGPDEHIPYSNGYTLVVVHFLSQDCNEIINGRIERVKKDALYSNHSDHRSL